MWIVKYKVNMYSEVRTMKIKHKHVAEDLLDLLENMGYLIVEVFYSTNVGV